MPHYKSFIIHLARSMGRKAQVQDLVEKSPFESQIIDAVDGANLSAKELDKWVSQTSFLKPYYPFGINPGEVGCFLSHRKAWQEIVDQNLDAALVFEDDVHVDPVVFKKSLAAAKNWSNQYGFIQFQVRGILPNFPVVHESNGVKLLQPSPALLRCSCQLISRQAAETLLEVTKHFDRPVDTLLQMFWETGVPIVCVSLSGVSDRTQETGGSSLSIKQNSASKLKREWIRFKYRRQISRLSKKHG